MLATIQHKGFTYKTDLSRPIDISVPMNVNGPRAWYVDPMKIEAVRTEHWIGAVAEGGAVNFRNIFFNPHGHGTHTECLGHITSEVHSVNRHVKQFFFVAALVSILPEALENGDYVITRNQIETALDGRRPEAVIIRTITNTPAKLHLNWSNTNPPYLLEGVGVYLAQIGVKHLLIDLPSVDRESDEGKLLCHHAFWQVPENPRMDATITEFIYVPNEIFDGDYLLNLQFAPFENDAAPSRPVLFRIIK